MFKEKMVTEAIPERVYTLCKIVEKSPISTTELKEKMEPSFLNNGSIYFYSYRNAAEELKLISISDNMVSLSVDPDVIASIESLRRYTNGYLYNLSESQYYQVTSAYYSINYMELSKEKNIVNLSEYMSRQLNLNVDVIAMRAWRFWASFLGFGYLHNMFMIPNADVFLWDIISISKLEKNVNYSFSEFINGIRPYCDIVINPITTNRSLNYGVSNGLRTLHDNGYIKLEHILDQEDLWNLYELKAHPISNTVTNITILK